MLDLSNITSKLNTKGPKYHSEKVDETGNRYYVADDGSEHISVTTLLKAYEDTEALERLKASLGEDYINTHWVPTAAKGTANHKQIELYADGKIANFHELEYPYLEAKVAITAFYSKVPIISTEQPVFYNHPIAKVAGRYDSLVYIPANTYVYKYLNEIETYYLEEGLYITDLKTKTKMPNIKDLRYTFKHSLQGAAYSTILTENSDVPIKGFIIVYVTEKNAKIVAGTDYLKEYYWNCFKLFLHDYFKIQPTVQTWNSMLAYAAGHLDEYGIVESFNLPEIIYLPD